MSVSPPPWVTQTPNFPGLHNLIPFDVPGAGMPNAQQWIATLEALTEYFIGEIAIAFGGISILGWHPFAFLQTWGENLQQQAQDAFTGQETANTNLATLIDVILGTGHTFEDLGNYLAAAAVTASAAGADITTLLNGVLGAGHSMVDFVAYLAAFPAGAISGALNPAVTFLVGSTNVALSTLFQNLTTTGAFAASGLTGALNTGVTIAGNAVSSLFNGSGVIASQIAGALNPAVTISGNAISSLFSSGGALASALTGPLNPAVTFLVGASNVALSTLLGNLTATGSFAASALTGALNTGVTIAGNAISSLFNGSGVLASALTGGLNPAVTIAGNPISALFNAGGVLGSAITGALNPVVTVAGVTVDTIRTNAASALSDAADIGTAVENAAAGTLVSLGTIGTQVQTGFSGFISALHAAFTGGNTVTPPTASQSQVSDAAAALQQQLVNIGNGGEESVDIEFSAYSNGSLPSDFTLISGTGWSIASHLLTYNNAGQSVIYYNAANQLTDYGIATAIFPTRSGLNGPGFMVRQNTNGVAVSASYIAAVGGWQLAVGSAAVNFGDTFTPGAEYAFVYGDPANKNPYYFQLLKNGAPLTIISSTIGPYSSQIGQDHLNDSSHLSTVGGGFRGAGLFGNNSNFTVSSFKFRDTTPSSPSVLVATAEVTGSTTYTDLTTVSDEVAVNIGASGKADVRLSCQAANSGANFRNYVGFSMSGANTAAADDSACIFMRSSSSGVLDGGSITVTLTDLNPGLTVFKMKYRCPDGGTGTFSNRRIGVVALT
ncbi:hypothetical protein AWC11_11335 [Mycobacterium interjectum]|nr:hypothetical protein AWC11_11335 [Mycobacterium interjectum]